MQSLANRLLDRQRTIRLATLDAYRSGCPPLPYMAASERRGFYQFHRLSRTNMARKVVRACGDRMTIRSIRTAAAADGAGDDLAWRYFKASGLDIASADVHSDQLTFSEGYVRVTIGPDGVPIALRRDPRFCIAVPDPLNPLKTLAAFEMVSDEFTGLDYAYLWLAGKQYVATAPRASRLRNVSIPGISGGDARRFGWWWPQLSFSATAFTMRPMIDDVPEDQRDGEPYSMTYEQQVVPVVRFDNRDGVGEFEEHLDVLDRIHHTVLTRVVTAAVQAYKQRALRQQVPASGAVVDRLPSKNPQTGEDINWAEIFEPGPDALWKLPPGVDIWESSEVQLKPLLDAVEAELKTLAAATDTPLPLLSDDVNQSAEGAVFRREGLVFRVEDRERLAGRKWADVIALLFLFAPEKDRYAPAGRGKPALDRADAGQIIIDWAPVERFSLGERADADAKNKTLSLDMAASKIWGLSPNEVAINRQQRKDDINELPLAFRVSQLPAGLSDTPDAPPVPPATPPQSPPAADPAAAAS